MARGSHRGSGAAAFLLLLGVSAVLLAGPLASRAAAQPLYTQALNVFQASPMTEFEPIQYTHSYDGSVIFPTSASLAIVADDIDTSTDGPDIPINVLVSAAFLGSLTPYGGSDSLPYDPAPDNEHQGRKLSTTVFWLSPSLLSAGTLNVYITGSSNSLLTPYDYEIEQSFLTVFGEIYDEIQGEPLLDGRGNSAPEGTTTPEIPEPATVLPALGASALVAIKVRRRT